MPRPVEISPPPDARHLLFAGLIDFAGLFPPASLDMSAAVSGYRQARSTDEAWIVDRFIVPSSRLEELAGALVPTLTADEEPWPLSLLVDLGSWPEHDEALTAAAAFVSELAGAARFEIAEAKVPADGLGNGLADVASAAAASFAKLGAITFLEMPLTSSWADEVPHAVAALAAAVEGDLPALGAKLRCGGMAAELFPAPAQVALFIASCRDAGIRFKCTAGLHHPFRHDDPETGFTHHGFLNILGASLLAYEGAETRELEEIVDDRNPESFRLRSYGFGWKDRWVTADAIDGARNLFVGYGSCSFSEPVADLAALGALPG